MSGIVAILSTNGASCDAVSLRELTHALAFRGPDGIGIEVRGAAGLGAALFRTTKESAKETQPLRLEGKVWIVSDCHIDDRAALIAELCRCAARAGAPDVELTLHAYPAWRRGASRGWKNDNTASRQIAQKGGGSSDEGRFLDALVPADRFLSRSWLLLSLFRCLVGRVKCPILLGMSSFALGKRASS
jgi:hypothetical protein